MPRLNRDGYSCGRCQKCVGDARWNVIFERNHGTAAIEYYQHDERSGVTIATALCANAERGVSRHRAARPQKY